MRPDEKTWSQSQNKPIVRQVSNQFYEYRPMSDTKPDKPNPVGRPTKYRPEMIEQGLEYIKDCTKPLQDEPVNVFPSIQGFGLYLHIASKRIQAWKALDIKDLDPEKYPRWQEFQDMLDQLHDTQFVLAMDRGAKREITDTVTKLIAAKHGYHSSLDVLSGGKAIKPAINIGVDSD